MTGPRAAASSPLRNSPFRSHDTGPGQKNLVVRVPYTYSVAEMVVVLNPAAELGLSIWASPTKGQENNSRPEGMVFRVD
jgi:hypothetical protein